MNGGSASIVCGREAHLSHVDDDVAGGVDDTHEVVPAGEVIHPDRPVEECSVLNHLVEVVFHCQKTEGVFHLRKK